MADIKFTDNSVKVKSAMNDAWVKWLYEASMTLESQVVRNTAVDTGQLKGSWKTSVDESKGEAVVGSPLENAIWEEFGTGEYALKGNGRKGGWSYQDKKGKWHHTKGKKPRRAMHNAYQTKKTAVIRRAEEIMKSEMK